MSAACLERFNTLLSQGRLSPLDLHFAGLMQRLAGRESRTLFATAALLSGATREGHICLDLRCLSEPDQAVPVPVGGRVPPADRGGLAMELRETRVVGRPGERRPMVLDEEGRLYLYRYWEYENRLISWVRERAGVIAAGPDPAHLSGILPRLFQNAAGERPDWQMVATVMAVFKPFCVISGGPGTGKTTTVARILALLLEIGPAGLRIALTAPTGKAAARLQASIEAVRGSLEAPPDIKARIPGQASTVHRLLGAVKDTPYFRHHAANPVAADLVVVDEASMLDVALLCKLVQALPQKAHLILLGDRDQLASVEAGAVLGDICGRGRPRRFSRGMGEILQGALGDAARILDGNGSPGLGDCIVQLQKNYRFGGEGGIGDLSAAVNAGDGARALRSLEGAPGLCRLSTPAPEHLAAALQDVVLQGYGDYLRELRPEGLFERFDRLRILCALREGPYGVRNLNRTVRGILARAGLLPAEGIWYAGRPVMIILNDYRLKLFNGDVGITLRDGSPEGGLRVFFPGPQGTLRGFHPLRLPEHETVFAMTVHKSQGSEFDKVLLVLPDRDYPLLTRELVYTALTRARREVAVLAGEAVFKTALSRRIERSSGLGDALWRQPCVEPLLIG